MESEIEFLKLCHMAIMGYGEYGTPRLALEAIRERMGKMGWEFQGYLTWLPKTE